MFRGIRSEKEDCETVYSSEDGKIVKHERLNDNARYFWNDEEIAKKGQDNDKNE